MIYGLIDSKNHKIYTQLKRVFKAINNEQKNYNWLLTDCECYPSTPDIEEMLNKEYCWISGDELTDIIEKEDFQWIWGAIFGFEKDIPLSDVLSYPLPFAQGYIGYFKNPVSLQHPLASIEIVSCDSSYMLLISRNKEIFDKYMIAYPKCQDLSQFSG